MRDDGVVFSHEDKGVDKLRKSEPDAIAGRDMTYVGVHLRVNVLRKEAVGVTSWSAWILSAILSPIAVIPYKTPMQVC